MSETLVIRLGAAAQAAASWVTVDATGAVLSQPLRGQLTEAAVAAGSRNVIVLVPPQDVLRVRAELPVKSSGRVLQALPFALEEQLAEDVEELHFAAGSRAEDGRVEAAAVRRGTMDDWVARLAAGGITAQRIYSEADAAGGMPNTVTLLIEADRAVIAEPSGATSVVDLESLEGVLDLWLAQRADSSRSQTPCHVLVYGETEALEQLGDVLDRLRARVDSLDAHAMAGGILPRLAASIVTQPGVNLLQGDYLPRSSLLALWPAWRIAAMLLVGLGVVAAAAQWADVRRMKVEGAALDATIDAAFHYAFPSAGPVQNARAQLSSQLQQLGAQGPQGSHEFFVALQAVAQAINASEGARIEGLNYRSGTLDLRLRAPSVEALDRIQQSVSQANGLKAQIQSANAAGDQVVGRLQITRAGS